MKITNEQKQHLIDMMKLDEESGLYDETEHLLSTQANRNRLLCKDCNKSLDNCTCLQDTIDMKQETTLEEVLGSSMCQFSVIENKLAILYRNQVKIYDAVTKEQQGYSEEEVIELLKKALTHKDDGEIGSLVTAQGEIRTANFFSWFNKFKNK